MLHRGLDRHHHARFERPVRVVVIVGDRAAVGQARGLVADHAHAVRQEFAVVMLAGLRQPLLGGGIDVAAHGAGLDRRRTLPAGRLRSRPADPSTRRPARPAPPCARGRRYSRDNCRRNRSDSTSPCSQRCGEGARLWLLPQASRQYSKVRPRCDLGRPAARRTARAWSCPGRAWRSPRAWIPSPARRPS